ncbi:MAG: TrpR-like protein YerC/YecD [Clostridia bacterium]|nr:TrpR-like protein YerC/YecD [Clostridia bacterium]
MIDKLDNAELQAFFSAILTLETAQECSNFFEDICTIKEIQDISQRLEVAKQLKEGKVYTEIAASTGASTATISRVNKCLSYGSGGYKTVLERLEKKSGGKA